MQKSETVRRNLALAWNEAPEELKAEVAVLIGDAIAKAEIEHYEEEAAREADEKRCRR